MKLTGSQFQCWHCRLHFAGERAFARHRSDMQCLTVDAMRAAGWSLTRTGFWTLDRPDDATSTDRGSCATVTRSRGIV
jgi:hypothetical protein